MIIEEGKRVYGKINDNYLEEGKRVYGKITLKKIDNYGYSSLIGENITVFCCRYIYHGKLIEEGKSFIKIQSPSIVYETGCFTENNFKDIQSMNTKTFSINKDSVESFGILDNKNESE